MQLRLFAKVIVFIVLLANAGLGQNVSIQVETKNVGPARADYLRILSSSDIPLAGLQIPLRIGANSDIVVDSVSFQYTMATGNFTLNAQITNTSRAGFVRITPDLVWPIPTFPSGWGEICRIHFHTTTFVADAFVPIDTFYRSTLNEQIEASDAFGSITHPSFTPGGIQIRQTTSVEDGNAGMPKQYSLGQNFPNPFNPTTQIVFSLMRSDHVRLDVYNVAGQRLVTLAEGRYSSGEHVVIWDAGTLPSGVYFYRLTTNSGVLTRKMLLIK